jgi:hypothetical protein
MTLEQFHKKLKSTQFISINHKKQHFTFRFTEVHLFRDDEYLCDYTLSEKEGNFKMKFSNLDSNITGNGFQNVLFIIDNQQIVVNQNSSLFKGKYDVIMGAQK